jgi:hypothetical protein
MLTFADGQVGAVADGTRPKRKAEPKQGALL